MATKDTFDVLNNIFDNFVNDTALPGIMGITDTSDTSQCEAKFRRSFADMTVVDAVNFIDFSFVQSNSETENCLVNKEMLEINIYASNTYQASMIYKEIHRIFKEKYKGVQCTTPCQGDCPIGGIVRYNFTAKIMVSS